MKFLNIGGNINHFLNSEQFFGKVMYIFRKTQTKLEIGTSFKINKHFLKTPTLKKYQDVPMIFFCIIANQHIIFYWHKKTKQARPIFGALCELQTDRTGGEIGLLRLYGQANEWVGFAGQQRAGRVGNTGLLKKQMNL